MVGVKDHHQEIQDLENRVLCRTEKWGHEKQLGEPRNIKNIIYIYISVEKPVLGWFLLDVWLKALLYGR